MKVRIGVAISRSPMLPVELLGPVVDDLDRLGFDSIWLPETFLGPTYDPLVGLAYTSARVQRLKLGTHLILPGRNVVRLAKALAELDRLSGGRLLITAVLGLDDPLERATQGLAKDRSGPLAATMTALRELWSGRDVEGAVLPVRPLQDPLEMWMGGRSEAAQRQIGRLADGWLPGGLTLDEAVAGKGVVEASATVNRRQISPEHFGTNISYSRTPLPDAARAEIAARAKGVDVAARVPIGRTALRETVAAWVGAGFSKLVVRPALPPTDWHGELEQLAEDVLDLQT